MPTERNDVLTRWTLTALAERLAMDELIGSKDPELTRALEGELARRVGLHRAVELVEAAYAPIFEEHQEWALEQLGAWYAANP